MATEVDLCNLHLTIPIIAIEHLRTYQIRIFLDNYVQQPVVPP